MIDHVMLPYINEPTNIHIRMRVWESTVATYVTSIVGRQYQFSDTHG